MARSFSAGDVIVGINPTNTNFNYDNPFTVCGWFNISTSTAERPLVSIVDAGASYIGWELQKAITTNKIRFVLINAFPTYCIDIQSSASYVADSYAHYAVTYSGSTLASGVNLYISGAVGNGTVAYDTLGSRSTRSGVPARVGARYNQAAVQFAGNAADVAVWNVELSAGEIAGLAKGIRPWMVRQKSLVLYWPLDGLGSIEPDLSGSASLQYWYLGNSGSGTDYAGGYTVISRAASFLSAISYASVDIYSVTAWSGKLKIMRRNAAGDYTLIQEQAWSHGGTGWETTTLSPVFDAPATGTHYVGIYSAGVPTNSTASQARSYHSGDTGTSNTGWTENTGGSFGCRTGPSIYTNNGILVGTAYANNPPVTMFTPRWPRNIDVIVAPTMSQKHFRFRTDAGAVDATPTWGADEDAA